MTRGLEHPPIVDLDPLLRSAVIQPRDIPHDSSNGFHASALYDYDLAHAFVALTLRDNFGVGIVREASAIPVS